MKFSGKLFTCHDLCHAFTTIKAFIKPFEAPQDLQFYIKKRDSGTGAFLWILRIFFLQNIFRGLPLSVGTEID